MSNIPTAVKIKIFIFMVLITVYLQTISLHFDSKLNMHEIYGINGKFSEFDPKDIFLLTYLSNFGIKEDKF